MKKSGMKLDYSKIKGIAMTQNVTMAQLASLVGMSDNGFTNSIRSGDFKSKNVILICEKLNISPNEFFGYSGEASIAISQSGIRNNQTNNLSSISVLEKQLEVKDKQIEQLMSLLNK